MKLSASATFWLWIGAASLLALASANPALSFAAIATLALIVKLLWREGESPALAFMAGYTWLQASIAVFYCDFLDIPLEEFDLRALTVGGRMSDVTLGEATWLTLGGLAMLAIGSAWAAGPRRSAQERSRIDAATAVLSVPRLAAGCLVALVLAQLVLISIAYVPVLRVPLLALANLHWVLVFLLAVAVARQRTGWWLLFVVIGCELAAGFLAFFSEFRNVLIITFIALVSVRGALRGGRMLSAASIAMLALVLGLVWTAVKNDYRSFMTRDTADQVVRVTAGEQVEALLDLVGDLTPEKLGASVDDFVHRLSYVYFFAETLEFVPKFAPHEHGALWLDAFTRTVVPRVLNPDKEVIDDSERTAKYTGLLILGALEGTSVSLGYFAEAYIDFGRAGMMAALLAWGWVLGRCVRALRRAGSETPLGDACATVLVAINASSLDQSNAKMVGGVIATFVIFWVLERYFLRRAFWLFARRVPRTRVVPGGA